MTEELNLLREALRRVKYEAASLADAQVIALEALTQRPAAQTWDKNADVCKGAWELGTACGTCAKCIATKPAQRPAAQEGEVLKCTMTHTPVWKPGSFGLPYQESNFACKTCGYVGNHDKHPGCKRASLPAPQQATPFPFTVVADPSIAPGEAVATLDGKEVGRIVGIDTQQATPEPVGGVVAWWYLEDGEVKFGHPNGHRPTDARPLVFADTRPAPGVPEDVQRNAARWEEVLRQVGADHQCGGFRFTLYNLRPIPGSSPMQGAVCQHFTQAVDAALAAAQAKKGE